jgi:hypothetical protein
MTLGGRVRLREPSGHLIAVILAAVHESGYGPFRPFAATPKTSGIEDEAEVDVACTKRRD